MQLTLERTGDANRIRAYDIGTVTVNETVYRGVTVVTPDRIIEDWSATDVGHLGVEQMRQLIALDAEILLLGTGRRQQFPPSRLLGQAMHAGIGIEVMTTEAACRTYNVLLAEGRQVAAALFPIEE
ncbi:Mth938-like domain-containing protein [Methylonatrum kenyense]|uniref:Mth938-like domain-containing protein n=1 Tax=Methylonatrum kenyense TaxID=455253 RepID=UPI0020BE8DB8|nr:Mth938-like domain-containing protein [Methylonatrum kenyense]MCK8516410.1 Mth938-like domain-containing protein [Methylonatrum kenyense]